MSINFQAGKRAFVIELVDELISEISNALKQLKKTNSPELVELKRALIKAKHLRIALDDKGVTLQKLMSLSDSVIYLIEVTKRLYSFFINYVHKIINKYEARENNKIIAHCRRDFANFSGKKHWCFAHLSFSS